MTLKHMVLINLVLIWLMVTYVFDKKMKKLAFHIMAELMLLPQGFIPGPILFNKFINDIFLFIQKSRIYANLLTITFCSLVEIISH